MSIFCETCYLLFVVRCAGEVLQELVHDKLTSIAGVDGIYSMYIQSDMTILWVAARDHGLLMFEMNYISAKEFDRMPNKSGNSIELQSCIQLFL